MFKTMHKLKESFLNPDREFTPIPFWFWNDKLYEAEIKKQMEDFNKKGVHAFVIHPRIGLPPDLIYMSKDWLDLVKYAVCEASRLDMQVVLYDEGMYPSGSAHGMVVKTNPDYASRGLRRVAKDTELAAGDIVIYEQDGILYVEGFTGGTIRGVHFGEDDGESGAPPSTDLLNPDAIKLFLELTHEKYFTALQSYFGNTIIGMFTDEPCIMGRGVSKEILPWGAGFLDYYKKLGGKDSDIPKLWSNKVKYRKAINARLAEVYYQPISNWCASKNIALMGHPENSDDIGFQKYFHIPGQDLVLRWVAPENNTALYGVHSTQAKCSADAARHSGKRRNSNECFGACNRDGIPWNFTADDMKWYIDWLCVRGVNLLIPHAFYYSIEGERRFERPPDVGPNNIWWDDYRIYSDYMKRLCWLMTDSVNTAQVAVLCGENGLDWQETALLYQNQIEFNYLEDMYVLDENISEGCICVQQNQYNILLVPKDMSLSDEKSALLRERGVKVAHTAEEVLAIAQRHIHCTSFEPELRFSHIKKGEGDFYFFVNEGERQIETKIKIFNHGNNQKKYELWYPFEGRVADIETINSSNAEISVNLSIPYRGSVILNIS